MMGMRSLEHTSKFSLSSGSRWLCVVDEIEESTLLDRVAYDRVLAVTSGIRDDEDNDDGGDENTVMTCARLE